jgi:hypothetical protein
MKPSKAFERGKSLNDSEVASRSSIARARKLQLHARSPRLSCRFCMLELAPRPSRQMQSNVLLSKNLPGKSVACLTIRPSILANFVPEMIGVEFLSNHQLRCDKRDQVDEMTLAKAVRRSNQVFWHFAADASWPRARFGLSSHSRYQVRHCEAKGDQSADGDEKRSAKDEGERQ